tara:strand:+ start:6112 stop:8328 length:2217 start_codon:yes stop_codon:yes gene_type:complete
MAEMKTSKRMPLSLLNYGYLPEDYEVKAEPVVSPGQVAWFGTQMVPGSSAPDLAGRMPGPPSYDQPASEFMSGEPMPSYAENIEQGNYFDATMQAIGGAGDAISYAAPIFGPFSVLPYGLGRGMKGLGTAGQMLKATANMPKVDNTLVFTGDRKTKNIVEEEDAATASSRTNNRNIETVSERGVISLLNDQDYLKKKGIKYDDPTQKYDVLDVVNRSLDRIPKNNSGQRNHLQRQFDEYLPDEFVNGPPRTLDEIMQELARNKPTVKEHVNIQDLKPDPEKPLAYQFSSQAPATPIVPAELDEYTTVSDVYAQIQPKSYGTTSFSIHGGKYGDQKLFTSAHESFGGYNPRVIPGEDIDVKFNSRNRLFHNRFAVYDMPDGKVDYVAVESQSDPYQLTTKSDMYRSRGGKGSVQQQLLDEGFTDLTYTNTMTKEEIPMSQHPLNPKRLEEEWLPDLDSMYIRGTRVDYKGGVDGHPYEDGFFGARAKGFRNTFSMDGSLVEHGYEHPMQTVITEYFDDIVGEHVPFEEWSEVNKVQESIQEDWLDVVDDWRDQYYSDGIDPAELNFDEAGLTGFLERSFDSLKPLMSKLKIAEAPVPMIDDWYHISTKSHIQNAIAEGADRIKFPINDRALTEQMMGAGVLPPQMRNFDRPMQLRNDTIFTKDSAVELGKKHKKFNKQALNTIEQEYGINLNRKTVKDRFDQEFIEIEITPEIKEAFQTLLLSRGGLVRQPLMNLKYDR